MRYLVATDGSEEANAAVRYASTHALAFDATLEIVHVLTPETELIEGDIVLAGEDRAIEMGERTLDRAERLVAEVVADRDAPDAEVDVETDLLTGAPAAAIVERSREADADAIYVGHRGLSEQQEQVVGSVAKSIVDKASVPVTIMR